MSTSVPIRNARPDDAAQIAVLHSQLISWGMLSQFGVDFLTVFYDALLRSPLGSGWVVEEDGRVMGFVAGVRDWRRFYRSFLRGHLGLAARLFFGTLRDGRWRRLLETTRYALAADLPKAEFVSMAIVRSAWGRGWSEPMINHALAQFAAEGLPAVRWTTSVRNAALVRVLGRMGFRPHARVELHPGTGVFIYVVPLTSGHS